MTKHISSKTYRAIREELGCDFVFVNSKSFKGDDDDSRCIYTVRRPRGKRCYHLVGRANGEVTLIDM